MADLYVLDDKSLRAQIFDSIGAAVGIEPYACTCQLGCEATIESCTVTSEGACGESCTTAIECSQCRCQPSCLSCDSACQQNCECTAQGSECSTSCEKKCQNCEGGCSGSCQTTCQTSCQSCNTCEDCEGGCSGYCQSTCQLSCQCSGQNDQCTTGCEVNCESTCQKQCQATCDKQCQATCDLYCESGCQVACQKCNSCQSKCEKGSQALTSYIGAVNTKSKPFTRTATANYTTLATYINKALDACAYTDAKLDASVSLKDVLMDDSLFDKIKVYVNKIANTTLSTSISGDSKIAANDMSKIENALNSSTIPNTIPCCEDSNNQNCIYIQSGCFRRQDS